MGRITTSDDELSRDIMKAAVELHDRLGPGLLESVYKEALADDLERNGLNVEREKSVPFRYRGRVFRKGFRVDLVVNRRVVVEVKSVERIPPVYEKQVLTYLKLLHLRVGLLINFGCATLMQGYHRVLNGYE